MIYPLLSPLEQPDSFAKSGTVCDIQTLARAGHRRPKQTDTCFSTARNLSTTFNFKTLRGEKNQKMNWIFTARDNYVAIRYQCPKEGFSWRIHPFVYVPFCGYRQALGRGSRIQMGTGCPNKPRTLAIRPFEAVSASPPFSRDLERSRCPPPVC